MRLLSLIAALCALSACSTSPPPPPKCVGDFRPINIQTANVSALTPQQNLALCTGVENHGKA